MSETVTLHDVHVSRFCGPERADGGSRRMMSLYACTEWGDEPVELTPEQAIEVATALVQAAQGSERTEYVIRMVDDSVWRGWEGSD